MRDRRVLRRQQRGLRPPSREPTPDVKTTKFEEALLHQARDFWLERSALPQSAAQADGACVASHGLHSFFSVLGAHAFERLVDQIHVASFEVKVLVLLRVGVVRGVLGIFCFRSRCGSEQILYVAQGCIADDVAFDVRLPADGVAVPLTF